MLAEARAGTLGFGKKLLPESRHTVFIVDRRCPEFGVRGRVKFDVHRRLS
jgi:hypothetical protein